MSRYLVVANQTIGGDELMDEIRRRIKSGPGSFYVVVPTMPVPDRGMDALAVGENVAPWMMANESRRKEGLRDEAEKVSQSRLNQLTSQIRAEGGEADGQVGGSDPVKAIDEVITEGGCSMRSSSRRCPRASPAGSGWTCRTASSASSRSR